MPTIEAYDTHGDSFARRYRNGARAPIERLKQAFGHRYPILEIGIGGGIDMDRLLEAGYDSRGLEPAITLIDGAVKHFPRLKGRITQGALPLNGELLTRWHGHFRGILCSAVLMHLKEEEQGVAIQNMYDLLRINGRLFLTVSATRDGLNEERRDEYNRYYAELPYERVIALADVVGFELVQAWHDDDQWHRRGLEWTSYVFEKKTNASSSTR
ncbi:class I SAM-dependent methyltransferase [Cerasicoccus maritimus]|uniref:class I SAM-dependent methyltransferase n=1 Tax=Cerasicoccus maritimus TaxID=490089 RepID=UPI0028528C70|nr:class I SAM-dependent methyltransferase [Cerasicoccus maritimus]